MERILVSMQDNRGEWDALSRAFLLAKRMEARVFVLWVRERPNAESELSWRASLQSVLAERLELLIEQGRREGISIAYFVADGEYEKEVTRFIRHHQVSLFVTERQAQSGKEAHALLESLHRIRRQTGCRVEVIQQRQTEKLKQRRMN